MNGMGASLQAEARGVRRPRPATSPTRLRSALQALLLRLLGGQLLLTVAQLLIVALVADEHLRAWLVGAGAVWVIFASSAVALVVLALADERRASELRQAWAEAEHQSLVAESARRIAEVETGRQRFQDLVETANIVPWEIVAPSTRFGYVGPQAEALLGVRREEWLREGFLARHLYPADQARVLAYFDSQLEVGADHEIQFRMVAQDGRVVSVRNVVCVRKNAAGSLVRRGVLLNVTDSVRMESELAQAQKLESVGRLAAGVAHEINTPIQFVSDSIHFLRDGMMDLSRIVAAWHAIASLPPEDIPGALAGALEVEADADLPYLMEHVPRALERSLDGIGRVAAIVRAMKEFAHPGRQEMALSDLNRGIENTLIIARNEYKYVADLETDLDDLPPVMCLAGDINQVILNIVVNAAHAIAEVSREGGEKGHIRVCTVLEDNDVIISISDDGPGIPIGVRERIFDPFFTTKEVGRGTGQGLAIARSVVVDKHGGTLTFETTMGKGTTFFVRLPVKGRELAATEQAA